MEKMKALVFIDKNRIELEDKPVPAVGPNDALMRVTTTTICGTDIHILKGEYPVAKGLTIGHEPVGIIGKLGSEMSGFDSVPERLEITRKMGADHVIDFSKVDQVTEVMKIAIRP